LDLHNIGTTDVLAFDLVLLDLRLPDGSGLDVLKELNLKKLASHVIVISGEGTTSEAFQATQMGAFDYIEKPFTPERILVSVRRALEFNALAEDLEVSNRSSEMLGNHHKMAEIADLIARVAPTSGRVLITGESGTGKELVARAIYRSSQRSDMPMIKVNCAAIPHGLMESELFGHEKGSFTGAVKLRQGVFERSHGGTLFLDEIGELGLDLQAKLLRVLQSGEFTRVGGEKLLTSDVRLIAATNKDLKEQVVQGEFREDLYYRLNVVTIHTPPLRERLSDVPLLAEVFLKEACLEHSLGERTLSERALNELQTYQWPGNVRELRNLIERIAILAEDSTIDHIEELEALKKSELLPQSNITATESEPGTDSKIHLSLGIMTWDEFHDLTEREFLRFVLKQAKGNVSETARLLQLERAYLHRLLKKLGIQRDVQYT
jgi:DNA-binding NtrC family response regulator